MQKISLRPLFVALSLSLGLGGCAGFRVPVEEPTVHVRGVAVGSASFAGIDGRLDLDIMNPNPVGLPLRKVEWELEVAGGRLVRGETTLSQQLPARGTAPVEVALHIDALDALVIAPRLAGGDERYAVNGTLHFATSFGDLAVAFRHEGSLAN